MFSTCVGMHEYAQARIRTYTHTKMDTPTYERIMFHRRSVQRRLCSMPHPPWILLCTWQQLKTEAYSKRKIREILKIDTQIYNIMGQRQGNWDEIAVQCPNQRGLAYVDFKHRSRRLYKCEMFPRGSHGWTLGFSSWCCFRELWPI